MSDVTKSVNNKNKAENINLKPITNTEYTSA